MVGEDYHVVLAPRHRAHHALAQVLGLAWQRVQFTSDLLPADILGVSVFEAASGSFTFRKGPIFTQLLLATGALALAHVPALAPYAYTLTGLALGPVFPTVLAWLAAAAGARGPTALVFAAANLGGVVLPAVIGRLVDASSPAVIPTTVLLVVLACLSATLVLRRSAAPVR